MCNDLGPSNVTTVIAQASTVSMLLSIKHGGLVELDGECCFVFFSYMFKIFCKENNLRVRDHVHSSSLLPGPTACVTQLFTVDSSQPKVLNPH